MRAGWWVCFCLRVALLGLPVAQAAEADAVAAAALPPEAQQIIEAIRRGGPFLHPQDGSRFGNFEHRLPAQPRGYYREYTVPTPGDRGRGARRIIAGARGEMYYTVDHYRTFKRILE